FTRGGYGSKYFLGGDLGGGARAEVMVGFKDVRALQGFLWEGVGWGRLYGADGGGGVGGGGGEVDGERGGGVSGGAGGGGGWGWAADGALVCRASRWSTASAMEFCLADA